MMPTDLLVGVAVALGLVGILVPVLPGSLLILGAVAVWAAEMGTGPAWVVFAVVTLLLTLGAVVKYAVPGRRLKLHGVPNRTLLVGAVLGVVGFFVVPVVGLVLGFVLGIYLAEAQRLGRHRARASTWSALKAVGLSVLIELAAGLLAALTWLVGAVVV
ncbi:MAG TPA: DUF456 domain-containing protein [Nocardioidaceae bacterium]|nr:DUF456 domain-containing protein [Nocardioidaceae bacterium]